MTPHPVDLEALAQAMREFDHKVVHDPRGCGMCRLAIDGPALLAEVRAARQAYPILEEQLCVARARLRELGHAETVDEAESCCDTCDRAIAAERVDHPRAALASSSVPPPQDAARWLKAQDKATAPPVLEEKAQDDRRPPPPAELVDALQDSVHIDTGRVRAARSVKHAAQETAALKEGVGPGKCHHPVRNVECDRPAGHDGEHENTSTPVLTIEELRKLLDDAVPGAEELGHSLKATFRPPGDYLDSASATSDPRGAPPKAPAALPKEEVAPLRPPIWPGDDAPAPQPLEEQPSADFDPITCPIIDGDYNGPHGPLPGEQLSKDGSAAAPAPPAEIGLCPRCKKPDPLFGNTAPTNPEEQCWRRLLVAGRSQYTAECKSPTPPAAPAPGDAVKCSCGCGYTLSPEVLALFPFTFGGGGHKHAAGFSSMPSASASQPAAGPPSAPLGSTR